LILHPIHLFILTHSLTFSLLSSHLPSFLPSLLRHPSSSFNLIFSLSQSSAFVCVNPTPRHKKLSSPSHLLESTRHISKPSTNTIDPSPTPRHGAAGLLKLRVAGDASECRLHGSRVAARSPSSCQVSIFLVLFELLVDPYIHFPSTRRSTRSISPYLSTSTSFLLHYLSLFQAKGCFPHCTICHSLCSFATSHCLANPRSVRISEKSLRIMLQ